MSVSLPMARVEVGRGTQPQVGGVPRALGGALGHGARLAGALGGGIAAGLARGLAGGLSPPVASVTAASTADGRPPKDAGGGKKKDKGKKRKQKKGSKEDSDPRVDALGIKSDDPWDDYVPPPLSTRKTALAGALAGGIVSVSLYPMDTVKTVMQAERAKGMSSNVFRVFALTLRERGFLGLYAGLLSGVITAMPISGIYTSTYETVKAEVARRLPGEEWSSFGHCVAGGMASVATSGVFTPSEVIKKRLQVGGQYADGLACVRGVIKDYGVFGMWSGWGAVLARNVPHSIAKFYIYESLKKRLSEPDGRPPDTLTTLGIGGISGSTAAFITTPFDVVKTRIQTQVKGDGAALKGVWPTVRLIFREEGIKGLFRGLQPRVLIYITQGGIFFASYETIKTVLLLGEASARRRAEDAAIAKYTRKFSGATPWTKLEREQGGPNSKVASS